MSSAALPLAIVFALALLGLFVRDHFGSLYDDAFIYLRYVKNLRAGCGLRFNCTDGPVEAFTGPLYLALLSLGGVFTRKLLMLTQGIGAIALAGAMVTALLAARRNALVVAVALSHERHDTEWVLAQRPDFILTTKVRGTPWRELGEAEAGFYADWSILRAISYTYTVSASALHLTQTCPASGAGSTEVWPYATSATTLVTLKKAPGGTSAWYDSFAQ